MLKLIVRFQIIAHLKYFAIQIQYYDAIILLIIVHYSTIIESLIIFLIYTSSVTVITYAQCLLGNNTDLSQDGRRDLLLMVLLIYIQARRLQVACALSKVTCRHRQRDVFCQRRWLLLHINFPREGREGKPSMSKYV